MTEAFFKQLYEHIYDQMKNKFPRFCSCGEIFADEIDCNNRTSDVKGFSDFREYEGGIVFHRNAPCRTTICAEIKFDKKYEKPLKKYVMCEVFKRNIPLKHVADEITQIGNQIKENYYAWLKKNHITTKHIILGIGGETMDRYLFELKTPKIAPLSTNHETIESNPSNFLLRNYNILKMNKGRASLVLLEADEKKLEDHTKIIQKIRKYDLQLKKHTNILCLDSHKIRSKGYYGLDLNGVIEDPWDVRHLRKTVKDYLSGAN